MSSVISTTSESTLIVAKSGQSVSWNAIGSMTMCVSLLIAAEFMPVSLLTPIAKDLHATAGMAGQAVSISGFFAIATSLFVATFAARYDRRHVLAGLTAIMAVSLAVIAVSPNFLVLMAARALLGIVVGGFWSLATATVMVLVPEEKVQKALGVMYMGNALSTAFAAPVGSYIGGVIGWRGVFWALAPLAAISMFWQWLSLPSMPPQKPTPAGKLFGLLKRRNVAFATAGMLLTFSGAFCSFTYFRPFLENQVHANVTQLSLLLLTLGLAGFAGTTLANRFIEKHLYTFLGFLPALLGLFTLGFLAVKQHLLLVAIAMVLWGLTYAILPVCWSTWLSKGVRDEPESGGGLMVGAIQLAIMSGGAMGGILLDRVSMSGAFIGGAILLLLSTAVIGNGNRLRPLSASLDSSPRDQLFPNRAGL